MRTTVLIRAALFMLASGGVAPAAAQILETETARPLGRGGWEVSGNFEYQASSEGNESAVPFAIEYGLTDRLEILAEPVAWTAISPNAGDHATGVGDLEMTLTWLAREETAKTPALALAGELKLPTANNTPLQARDRPGGASDPGAWPGDERGPAGGQAGPPHRTVWADNRRHPRPTR